MAVTDIPARRLWKCDGCLKEVETGPGCDRPKHWCNLHLLQDAYDFQGCAVADGSVRRLLCDTCKVAVASAMNAAIEPLRAGAAAKGEGE